MKTRRLRNKKSYKSKRISKKAKVHHKKSKRHIKKRRSVTRKRGGKEFNPYRKVDIEYANPIMMIDTTIPPQPPEETFPVVPATPPGISDIRDAMDVEVAEDVSVEEETSPRARLFSETDDEDDNEEPRSQRMRL